MTGPDIRRAGLWLLLLAGGLLWALGSRENPRLRPGTRLTAIEAQLADGGSFRLSQEQGRVVVLNFWATWCGPCRQEAKVLSRLHRAGVRVVGLSVDELPLQTIAHKGRALGIDYAIGAGSAELVERLAIRSIPTTCVIGKDGAIAFSRSGLVSHDELARAVREAEQR
jgi:thiol-disulfide isomerase/thioredoxin